MENGVHDVFDSLVDYRNWTADVPITENEVVEGYASPDLLSLTSADDLRRSDL